MRKVNLTLIRPWIAKKVVELVGFEDEVVVEYAMGLLEDKQEPVCKIICLAVLNLQNRKLDPRSEKNADQFDRLPYQGHASFHESSMEPASRSAIGYHWYSSYFC